MVNHILLAYVAMAVAWFVFEVFIFNKSIPRAVVRGLIWPYEMSRVKRGTKFFKKK